MKNAKTIQDLYTKVATYLPTESVEKIKEAYTFAEKAHAGQLRHSGALYITHPVEVGYILADLEQDTATICAGLLHDVMEDTDTHAETLISQFGDDTYSLIDGVTKLNKFSFESKEEAQAENLRKMFLAMARDIRVVIIKLADRLHNMRTLKYMPPIKQQRTAKITRDIFSPLAHRLGMWQIKWELEDLTFYYLQYDEFQEIKKLVSSRREERESYVADFITKIEALIKESNLNAKVLGRPKHFYSIYKKLVTQELSFDELYDALGVRVIVPDIKSCYQALGLVHSVYKPINGRFKDYIAMPKSNLYQSLHTTVIGLGGKPVEVQIRTQEMDQIAEYGIAAHWRYKEGQSVKSFDANFAWLRQIIEQHNEKTAPKDFLQNLKIDLFIDEVFVFTPKGAVHTLPVGATPVDFAYRIHTEIGHCCIGAKINGHIATLDYKLKSGDRVEILTSKKSHPRIDWLQFVQTGQAKNRIKQWFKRQNVQENIQKGKLKLDKILLVSGVVPKEILTKTHIEKLLKHYETETLELLYLGISQGELSPKEVADTLKSYLPVPTEPELELLTGSLPDKVKRSPNNDIQVLGENNVMSHIAKCCGPLPGEPIIGFITMGYGVSIHRTDCKQIIHLNEKSKARLVQAQWTNAPSHQLYSATLRVNSFDRIGILRDILNTVSETKTNLRDVKTKTVTKGGQMRATFTLEIKDLGHLNQIKQAITKLADVISVVREYP